MRRIRSQYPKVEALTIEGIAKRGDTEAPMRLHTGPNGRLRFEIEGRELLVYDGTTLWSRSASEPVLPVAFGRKDRNLARLWLWSGQAFASEQQPMDASAWGESGSRLELRMRDGQWNGTLELDSDALPLRWRHKEGGVAENASFLDWRSVGEANFPFAMQLMRGRSASLHLNARSVTQEPSAEPSLFHRPESLQLGSTWLPDEDARVPILQAESGHLLVELYVASEGKESEKRSLGHFVIDSGAGLNCVRESIADSLGLQRTGTRELNAVSGKLRADTCIGPRIRVGPVILPESRWWMPNLDGLEAAIGHPISGILGFPLFAHAQVELDARGGWMALRQGAASKPAGAAELAFDGHAAFVLTDLDESPLWLRLDTGSSDGMTLHDGTVDRLNLLDGDPATRFVRLAGLDGERLAQRTQVRRFRLAGRGMRSLEATLLMAGNGALDASRSDGNLGLGILERAPITIDYQGAWLAWTPPGGWAAR
ncbi:MAG: hypothetical protein ACI835_005439 [Planctomycetota bacterium]|jgi:hypothetical protein